MLRYKIIVHGVVQNVSFRYNICEFANKHGIAGYVKNLLDKTVEIYFIGDEVSFEKLNNFINKNPGYSKVEKIKLNKVNEEQKFEKFQILY